MPRKKKAEAVSIPKPKTKTKASAKKTVDKPIKAKKITVKKEKPVVSEKRTKAVKTLKKVSGISKEPSFLKSSKVPSSFKHLPRQGETQLVAFIRDPQCVFTYWEVTPQRLEEVKKELKEEFKTSFMVLRLYRLNSNGEKELIDEIRLEPSQINRYVELEQAGGTYIFEIAQKTLSGKYISYVHSNPLYTAGGFASTSMNYDGQRDAAASEKMSEGLQAYFDQLDCVDPTESIVGISSMENEKRKRKAYRASLF